MLVNIYRVSTLVGWVEAEPKQAWRAAVEAVKAGAFSEGFTGPTQYEQPRGRVSFSAGPFRAVTAIRRDR